MLGTRKESIYENVQERSLEILMQWSFALSYQVSICQGMYSAMSEVIKILKKIKAHCNANVWLHKTGMCSEKGARN